MVNQFSRAQLLFGKNNIEKLASSKVIVFGVGGVGGYVVEAFARSGIGFIDVVDGDEVSLTNINRQILALHSTIGKAKVDVAEQRILDINPACKVTKYNTFFLPENSSQIDFSKYDYVVDCIDTVKGKIEIIVQAKTAGKPVITSMGAGNKVDPTKFLVTDVSKTSVCPLAKAVRNELKKRGIKKVKCVFSTEQPLKPIAEADSEMKGNGIAPGSCAFVPSVAGLIIAGEVIKDLMEFYET